MLTIRRQVLACIMYHLNRFKNEANFEDLEPLLVPDLICPLDLKLAMLPL